jgi:hypothetical protein
MSQLVFVSEKSLKDNCFLWAASRLWICPLW